MLHLTTQEMISSSQSLLAHCLDPEHENENNQDQLSFTGDAPQEDHDDYEEVADNSDDDSPSDDEQEGENESTSESQGEEDEVGPCKQGSPTTPSLILDAMTALQAGVDLLQLLSVFTIFFAATILFLQITN